MKENNEQKNVRKHEDSFIRIMILLVIIGIINLSCFIATGTNMYTQYVIYDSLKEQIPEILSEDWKVSEIHWHTIHKDDSGNYKVYVAAHNDKIRIEDTVGITTCANVITDKHGNILENGLISNIEQYEYFADYYSR